MLFLRVRIFIVSAFFVGCCFASLPAYPGRIKNIPLRSFPLQNQPLDIISTGGVAIDATHHTIKKTRIHPRGTTSCSQSETNDGSFIYCQGEEQKTQFTLEAPPRMQTLAIEADAITRIENGARICHVSPGEKSSPHIHCDAPPKDRFCSDLPYSNDWVPTHYKQFKEQGGTLNSDSTCSEDDEINEDLPIQIRCDNPPQASPTVHRLAVLKGDKKPQKKCDVCQQSFKYPSVFKCHKRTHTGEKPYACNWGGCNQRFSHASSLHTHKRTHTGEKPYVCDWDGCNQRFSQTSHLKTHKRIHTGEKPYACDWDGCNHRCSKKDHLKYHKRVHTGEKPYPCDWGGCNKCFSQKSDLKKHKRIHTGEKPYACDGCNQRFSQSSHLNIHKRNHTGNCSMIHLEEQKPTYP